MSDNTSIYLTTEQYNHRRDLAEVTITLDGRPARITGLRLRFAVVSTVASGGSSCEFAWPTVERVISNGGKFKS